MKAIEQRDYLFDNMKALLIILVVFGHVMEEFCMIGNPGHVRAMIYCFHMPAFIFVSGYFSKNVKKSYEKAIEKCFMPFLVFNTLWLLLILKTIKVDILFPAYTFWYMLSLFWWRITLPAVKKIKFALIVFLLLGLYVGCFHEVDRFLSVSRTIVYYPFFLLGFYVQKEHIEKIRRVPKGVGLLFALLGLGIAFLLNKTEYIPVKAYENLQCYHCTGMNNCQGITGRGINIVLASVVIIGLLIFLPNKKLKMTSLGAKTVTIYLLSNFCILFLRKICDKYEMTEMIRNSEKLTFGVALLTTFVIVYICSRKYVCRVYNWVFEKIGCLLIKK